jgi:hypothetical protein
MVGTSEGQRRVVGVEITRGRGSHKGRFVVLVMVPAGVPSQVVPQVNAEIRQGLMVVVEVVVVGVVAAVLQGIVRASFAAQDVAPVTTAKPPGGNVVEADQSVLHVIV